ncbi:cytochrome P450 3A19 [Lingula anatina]|uniref:Cytochrome P450 3A19 n=1 Tax=Lingula anatina TaxID=7574 RepID=A0A1S3IUW2_LINAN|nr:cytochrome P450 3A19 [Lingula anatina]|eukprot:XP_013401329.1 cytochrome P450 3A19 [Lingula anatina]
MEALILACADRLVQNLKKKAQGDEDIDIKRMFDPYTMDVIASTSFGLHLDAQGNPNHPFIKNAKELMEPSLHSPVILILLFFPYLMKFLKPVFVFFNVTFVRTMNFFVNILDQLEKERALNPSEKNYADLVQLLLNSHNMSIQKSELSEDEQEVGKWKKKALTRAEMAANEILFLVAGYDTTSLTLTFASYFLATHPHVQDKLRSEIDKQLQGSDPTYESVKNLGYLEQVILETLRLYPPGVRVDRVATEDVVVRGLKIPKGTTCVIPIKTIHRHPDYWPDPDKFDPERFTPDAIARRHQFAFLGFGMGPRNCIGMRLAKLEMKIALVKILQRFTIKTCDETPTEITTRKDKPNRPGKPIILKVEERSF